MRPVSVPCVVMTEEPTAAPGTERATSAPARRLRRARWANPQLIGGVMLVLGCVAIGARVVTSADDTVPVMVAAENIGAGQELTADLVTMRDVRLDGGLDRYITGAVGAGYVVAREVVAGELVPRSAVQPAAEVVPDVRYVAFAVPSAELPAGLTAGSVVDVWISPSGGGDAKRLASKVRVSAVAGRSTGALGVDGAAATVTLAMRAPERGDDPSLDSIVGTLVSAGRDGRVHLSRLPAEGS